MDPNHSHSMRNPTRFGRMMKATTARRARSPRKVISEKHNVVQSVRVEGSPVGALHVRAIVAGTPKRDAPSLRQRPGAGSPVGVSPVATPSGRVYIQRALPAR